MLSKRFYKINEVSKLLSVPASTIRLWELAFPMFKPKRNAGRQRRYTTDDVKMAARIKELLYDKGLKTEAAIEVLNKTCRKTAAGLKRKCHDAQNAILLLDEVKDATADAFAVAKIDAVANWIKGLDMPNSNNL